MSSESKHDAPLPRDRSPKSSAEKPANTVPEDESIDFSHRAVSEEGIPGLSGAKSGSSVLTWDELIRQQSADEQVELGAADSGVEFDSASDQDILREALSGEKPPSKVIPRSGSHPEVKVELPADLIETTAAPNPAPTTKTADKTAAAGTNALKAAFPNPPTSSRVSRHTPIEDDDDPTKPASSW